MTRYRLSGALLAVLLLLVVTGTASATPPTASVLTLSVGDPNGPTTTVVELTCAPDGGTHPQPEPACDELVMAAGDFDELPGYQQIVACTMEYRPLVTTATGTWDGQSVTWQHEHSNRCTMLTKTGTVFDF